MRNEAYFTVRCNDPEGMSATQQTPSLRRQGSVFFNSLLDEDFAKIEYGTAA